jgi:hypothetical protein
LLLKRLDLPLDLGFDFGNLLLDKAFVIEQLSQQITMMIAYSSLQSKLQFW